METVRDAWTDERLDDLNHRVDDGFKEMRTEFRAVRSEPGAQIEGVRSDLGAQIEGVRSDLGAQIEGVRSDLGGQVEGVRSDLGGQIAALHRTMLQLFGGMFATFAIGVFAILTQL